MRRTLALLVVIALVAAAFFATTAGAYPVAHATKKSSAKVTRYWTAKRMRKAIPADLGLPSALASRAARGGRGGGGGGGGGGGRGGGGGGGDSSSGKSTEVPDPYPSSFGKVFFTSNSGVNYVCSGTAVGTSSKAVVWTAGHCVNEGPGSYYRNFNFVPAYKDGKAPYGEFAATGLLTTSGWQGSGEFGVDVGAAVVSTNGSGETLAQAVNELPVAFDSPRSQSYALYGYPAAKKFNGQRMRVCETSWLLDDTSGDPDTMGVACDMTGGSSGGPWVASGGVASVVSYHYKSLKNVLFGPHLESEAESLYNTALATP